MKEAHIAYVGLGSNLGNPQGGNPQSGNPKRNCQQAIELLNGDSSQVLACSSLYQTEPVGYTDQPHFINAVVKLQTHLPPIQLLTKLKAIENKLGKNIKHRWGPRTIDLDLLLYDNLVIDEGGAQVPHLWVPHPRMHTRSFVMIPMLELDPQLVHPLLGQSMQELLEKIEHPTKCIKIGPCKIK